MDIQDQIKAHLQNRMDPDQRKSFDAQLASDAELSTLYATQIWAMNAIENEIAQDTRRFLRHEYQKSKIFSNIWMRYWWIIPITILIALGISARMTQQKIQNQSYKQYALVDPKSFGVRGADQEYLTAFLNAYNDQDLASCELYADSLKMIDYDRSADIQLLIAQLQWRKKQYEQAEATYQQVAEIPQSRDKAQLQLLYFYAKTGQKEKFIELNTQLQGNDSYIFEVERRQIDSLYHSRLMRYLY